MLPDRTSSYELSSVDREALLGIQHNDIRTLKRVYADHLPATVRWVKKQGGNRAAALDVFQEMLLVLFKKVSEPGFQLTAPLAAYLAGTRRFIWMRRQRKKNSRKEVTIESVEAFIAEDFIEAKLEEAARRKLFQRKLLTLGKECQAVLKYFFAGQSLKEIARRMNYTYDYTKKKNSRCKQKLTQAVMKDPLYRELKTE